ncbi:MAG: long-chain-fatty-acid--CoA ligase [Flexibacter sp. CG_4_10_14_3_um_filter_32_15]|nr:MAG: long-chain-fatty-acid--CoA ligase [Flexibacter sp. CG_4_10_14_3_um_filter_32_15]
MDKIWLKSYPEGIPAEINPDEYSSLLDLFEESIAKYGDKIAYENMGATLTFNELDEKSAAFAAYLQRKGLQKGDRFVIQSPNLIQYPIAIFGILRAGLIVVNTNPLYTPKEMEHQFTDSGAKGILILANFASNLEKVIKHTSIEHVFVTEVADMVGGLKGWAMNMAVKYLKKMVPSYSIPNAVSFTDALYEGKKYNYSKPKFDSGDVAFLQYTGGTTGVSKGAMLTHRNILANMQQLVAWVDVSDIKEGVETGITALPLYHIFALTFNCFGFLRYGVKNVLITNPRDMEGFVEELKKHKIGLISGVNTLFNGLLNQPEFKNVDFSHLKVALGGGMAVQEAVNNRWKEITGKAIAEAYGLTETSPGLIVNPLAGKVRIGWIGLPLPSTEVRILDDAGNDVELGQPGEICGKGPQIMKGYWQRPEETANTMIGDYFKTGDIGVMDEEGYFKIVDRKKEMILVSGFNVYPNEVEGVIALNDKVLEVGVIGIPDEKSHEAIMACIVKKDDSLTKEEIRAFCKEHLTGYKVPKHVVFKDELPKSNVGKILRRVLKEQELGTEKV